MSKALVKKALALVEEGLLEPQNKKEEPPSKGKARKRTDPDFTPQHHKVIRYVGKKGHKEAKELLRRTEKLTVMEARKRLQNRRDHTEDNVRKLLLLSSASIDREASAKLIKRARTGRYVVKADEFREKEPVAESAFTEEDFSNFEKELANLC